MAMTFIQGQTLETCLEQSKHKKLSLQEVLDIGKQLGSVLHYLHTRYPPIIFRDVKPANIMRTPDGQIYLIDFGVARQFKSGQKKDTTPFGSPGYAAPEQFGKAQTTQRSDIYSLGATLYELLTGHEPASTPLQFPPLQTLEPSLPPTVGPLITQMLEHDESKRPANMLIVGQKLQEISGALWQTAATAFLPAKVSPTLQKPPRRLVLSILLVCFSLIVGGAIGGAASMSIGISTGRNNATVLYQQDATATEEAGVSATATAAQIIALPDPYPPQGTLALFDPLSHEYQWQEYEDASWGGYCRFKDNALQASQVVVNRMFECPEKQSPVFKNFAVQVNMTITQGDCGGITLRENSDGSKLYVFEICTDGSYTFYQYDSYDNNRLIASDYSRYIYVTGNTIAVVANSHTFDFYANGHKIGSTVNAVYDMGTIGFCVNSSSEATIALFQNAMIWALP
jgi:hypothetical protein